MRGVLFAYSVSGLLAISSGLLSEWSVVTGVLLLLGSMGWGMAATVALDQELEGRRERRAQELEDSQPASWQV